MVVWLDRDPRGEMSTDNTHDAMMSSRRGPWLPDEDAMLLRLVAEQGSTNWVRISQQLKYRSPKQCRERYHQNLKPTLNHDPITPSEGAKIEEFVEEIGHHWAEIARRLGNRSDNAVKNWWNGSINRRRRNPSRPVGNRSDPVMMTVADHPRLDARTAHSRHRPPSTAGRREKPAYPSRPHVLLVPQQTSIAASPQTPPFDYPYQTAYIPKRYSDPGESVDSIAYPNQLPPLRMQHQYAVPYPASEPARLSHLDRSSSTPGDGIRTTFSTSEPAQHSSLATNYGTGTRHDLGENSALHTPYRASGHPWQFTESGTSTRIDASTVNSTSQPFITPSSSSNLNSTSESKVKDTRMHLSSLLA